MSIEDDVFRRLWALYVAESNVVIHSAHPPSGKAYHTAHIPFRRKDLGAGAGRRYHLDYIVQIGDVLLLQELKGRDSESSDDITKLETFMDEYPLDRLLPIMRRRVPNPEALDRVSLLIPSLGFEASTTQLPTNFACFKAAPDSTQLSYLGHPFLELNPGWATQRGLFAPFKQ